MAVDPTITVGMFARILLQDSVVGTGSCGQVGLDLVIDVVMFGRIGKGSCGQADLKGAPVPSCICLSLLF